MAGRGGWRLVRLSTRALSADSRRAQASACADLAERLEPKASRRRSMDYTCECRTAWVVPVALAALMVVAHSSLLHAQRGAGPAAPPSPRTAAPIDLTGYWESFVTEDWRWRMVTPPKGSYQSVTLNAQAK